jgi:hypothetical protein
MKRRDRAKSLFNKTKNPVHWEKFKSLRNNAKRAVRNAKVSNFDDCINNEKNSKLFWNHLKKLHVHGAATAGNVTDANPDTINQHFVNNQNSLSFDQRMVDKQISHFLNCTPDNLFSLITVGEYEISDIIGSITTNASGSDEINLKAIKLFLPFIIPIVTHIINFSITSSSFPTLWKLAIINPILKSGRSKDPSNLRPISILPCLSKVLERVVANQLKIYLDEYGLLTSHQSGFRDRHSTTTALLKISNDILKAMDETKFTSLVLLDFAKAFDSVNHALLLAKLHAIGVDDLSVKWFKSYLTGRKQCVRIGDSTSSYLNVRSGVPQGSILGPLLFSVFINDLPASINNCGHHMFADDVQVEKNYSPNMSHTALAQLNNDLENINVWSHSNGISLNSDKCQHIIIGSPQLFQTYPVTELCHYNSVLINNVNLKTSQSVRNLGVIFDHHLSWDAHLTGQCRTSLQRLRQM